MCGRYSLTISIEEIIARFGIDILKTDVSQRFNIAPSQTAPIVVPADGGRALTAMRWGLIPFWAKDDQLGGRMINARAETVGEKPSFKKSFQHRRCLVPADGFYEWQKSGRVKRPFRITLAGGRPFAFAGLWDEWQDPAGKKVRSFTIITTAANSAVAAIHDRMPVILPREAEAPWLDPALMDPRQLADFLQPYPAEQMTIFEISPAVNSPKNDNPQIIAPLPPGQLREICLFGDDRTE